MVLLCFRSTMLKKHRFTRPSPKELKKHLQTGRPKLLKNHFLYRPGNRKHEKTIGCIQIGQPKPLKSHWFYYKTSPGQPGNRATGNRQRIRGLLLQYSSWKNDEEPLQTSCLREFKRKKNWKVTFHVGFSICFPLRGLNFWIYLPLIRIPCKKLYIWPNFDQK